MKKFNFSFQLLFGFILLVTVLFQSCKKKTTSDCGDPLPTIIQIGLVDKNDSLLIGSRYNPDSIKLMVQDSAIKIYFYKGWMNIHYNGFENYNNVNFILYLSKQDVDTLTFKVTRYPSDCFVYYYEFGGLTYNLKAVSPVPYNESVYRIIKE